ncbi:MAG TPA: amino acid adenylation domain-containing protein [Chitinophagaceae bacterium]
MPGRPAFCINEVFYTYKQLAESISKIRLVLKQLSKKDVHIGLVANDDIETYASILALWLEGKAYIPLHPNQPLDRCEDIIQQISIHAILDSDKTSRFLKYDVINTSNLEYEKDALDNDIVVDDDHLAYVLFTSGSTGTPKGVTLSRKNVGAFMDSFWDTGIQISESDKCLQCFDLTFDVSVQCYLAPLMRGACVYTIPHDQIKYSYVYGLLEDHKLTFAAVAPSMLRYLKPYFGEINLPALKYCILTGEASPADLVYQWEKCVPAAQLYNFYGPTETTIYCTYYKIRRGEEIKTLYGMLSIGKPMKNVRSIVVDEHGNALSRGEKGELCICGDQVSPGYWNSPEKNSQSFFGKNLNGSVERFYHTGDLCYVDDEDELMLFGRLDSQAKIQGYRVELGEIEHHAREHLKGKNAVVITFINTIGNSELAIFIEGEDIHTALLLDYIKAKVPPYMVPTKIMVEKEFPLNSNGKVDKRKLKEKITQ